MNDKITEKVLDEAADQGRKNYWLGENMNSNPFSRDQNFKLWESWINGWLDAKLEDNKLNKK